MSYIIREAVPADAEKIIPFLQQIYAEPGNNMRLEASEFTYTVAQEADLITEFKNSANSHFLVAEVAGAIVGVLTCQGSNYRAELHTTELGICIHQDWRGKGVGSALIRRAIDWAWNVAQLQRIMLFVVERNHEAAQLYQKFGFEIEGRLRRDFFRDGEYWDTMVMGLLSD